MGRRSKATQSRLKNFQLQKNQRAQVDDVTDEDEDSTSNKSGDEVIADIRTGLEHGLIVFEDYETGSDYDHIPEASDLDSENTDSDFENENDAEIRIEGDLLCFSAILVEAQRVAVKSEQECDAPRHPKQYTGNAPCMKRFHAHKWCTLAAKGQRCYEQTLYPVLSDFFSALHPFHFLSWSDIF